MKRKLAGKSEESDKELMNELQAQPRRQHDAANGESDSDWVDLRQVYLYEYCCLYIDKNTRLSWGLSCEED